MVEPSTAAVSTQRCLWRLQSASAATDRTSSPSQGRAFGLIIAQSLMRGGDSPFQLGAVPLAEDRRALIGAAAEFEQCRAWRSGGAHSLIGKDELRHLAVVVGRLRPDGPARIPRRLRGGIGIECRLPDGG